MPTTISRWAYRFSAHGLHRLDGSWALPQWGHPLPVWPPGRECTAAVPWDRRNTNGASPDRSSCFMAGNMNHGPEQGLPLPFPWEASLFPLPFTLTFRSARGSLDWLRWSDRGCCWPLRKKVEIREHVPGKFRYLEGGKKGPWREIWALEGKKTTGCPPGIWLHSKELAFSLILLLLLVHPGPPPRPVADVAVQAKNRSGCQWYKPRRLDKGMSVPIPNGAESSQILSFEQDISASP